jgi:hypothetical protein
MLRANRPSSPVKIKKKSCGLSVSAGLKTKSIRRQKKSVVQKNLQVGLKSMN